MEAFKNCIMLSSGSFSVVGEIKPHPYNATSTSSTAIVCISAFEDWANWEYGPKTLFKFLCLLFIVPLFFLPFLQ